MSEAMALEQMAQALAELEGFLTATRVPYLANESYKGVEKDEGRQLGDLDVIGIDPAEPSRLLVVECMGYGGPDDYENWLKPYRLRELAFLAWAASHNIQQVADTKWNGIFETRGYKPSDVWIIFSGTFWLQRNPSRWAFKNKGWQSFVGGMARFLQDHWDSRHRQEQSEAEEAYLLEAQRLLSKETGTRVRLIPVHELLRQLFLRLPVDMRVRRKRYPNTSLEMLRWIHRASRKGALDLSEIQDEYQNRDYYQDPVLQEE